MGPFEYFFLGIGFVIILVAIVRGYDRELGNSIVAQVAIFIVSFFESRLETALNFIGNDIFGVTAESLNLFKFLFMTIVFGSIIMASYWGVTFDFPGKPKPPPEGTLIAFGMGLLNAYLIVGTVWYFLDKYGYPIQTLGMFFPPLTAAATSIVQFLPPAALWSWQRGLLGDSGGVVAVVTGTRIRRNKMGTRNSTILTISIFQS